MPFATVRILLVVRRIARQNALVVAQLNLNPHKLQHGVAFRARQIASAKMIGIVVTAFLVCNLLEVRLWTVARRFRSSEEALRDSCGKGHEDLKE